MSYPFIVWTMQRTGGTALAEMLFSMSEHPAAEHEPFNWSRDKPREFWPLAAAWIESRDKKALGAALDALCSRPVLIKHCYELFDVGFNAELAAATLRGGYRHILLSRRDEPARLISKFIAEANGTWFKDHAGRVYADVIASRRTLQPIPVDLLVAQAQHARRATKAVRAILNDIGADVSEIAYEDLYLGERSARVQRFGALLDHLGFAARDAAAHRETFERSTQGGGQATYALLGYIPNIDAVIEGLAVAGLPPPADHTRRRRLDRLKAQLSSLASERHWEFGADLDREWPGFSFRFDHASSLAFRVESADMTFSNVYFGVKNKVPIHNKSLDEALSMRLGPATYSETWPWCGHPHPDDEILPIAANWATGEDFEQAVLSGALAADIVAAAETVRATLAASGYIPASERPSNGPQGRSASPNGVNGSGGPSASRPPASRSLFTAAYMGGLGLTPATIIDVGVLHGTRSLYDAFPDADFVLVDPQRGAEEMIRHRPPRYSFVNKALGAAPGWASLSDQGAKSGLVERTPLTSDGPVEHYDVEVATLDGIIADLDLKAPIGLKIDAEGYEVEILKGLVDHVGAIEFVICEASVRRRFRDGYTFADLVGLMRDKGFGLYTILNEPRPRPLFYDVLFLKVAHRLFD